MITLPDILQLLSHFQENHPGPIDNTQLKGSYDGELSRNIIEGKYYILLPGKIASKLFAHYTGGPNFPRRVVNTINQLAIKLWSIRIEMYICDRSNLNPTGEPIIL